MSDRMATGIEELDAMLRGGLISGDATLVAGSAGTGKTTLSLQFLYNGALIFGENGVFVTFEQLPEKIYRDASNFGWNLQRLEREGKLRVICTSPELLLKGGEIGDVLDEPIKETKAKRVCIDSVSQLEMYLPKNDVRKEAYRLINYLRTKEITSMLTSEVHQSSALEITGLGVSFLVDSVILLRFAEVESAIKKVLVVMKMRGSDHDKTLRQYEITATGVKVFQPLQDYEGILSGSPRRAASEKFMEMFVKSGRKGGR